MTENEIRRLAELRREITRQRLEHVRALAFLEEERGEILARCNHRYADESAALNGFTIRCLLCGRFADRDTLLARRALARREGG